MFSTYSLFLNPSVDERQREKGNFLNLEEIIKKKDIIYYYYDHDGVEIKITNWRVNG